MTKLIPLGVNGYFPSYGRNTMSYLVLTEQLAIILDAGTGLGRLMEQRIQDLLKPFAELNVFLSHYHLDHIIGLSYLPGVSRDKAVKIFGPSIPLVEADANAALEGLFQPPFFSKRLREFPGNVELIPLKTLTLQLGPATVSFRPQKHPGGSIGIRIGDTLAYLTDTAADEDSIVFVRGVNFLLHEVWLTDEDAARDPAEMTGHSRPSAVRDIAMKSAVPHLMPVHLHPGYTENQLSRLAAGLQAPNLEVVLPKEGQVYEIR